MGEGDAVSKCGVVNLINKNAEESGGLIVGIGLEFRVNLDNERGGDYRE